MNMKNLYIVMLVVQIFFLGVGVADLINGPTFYGFMLVLCFLVFTLVHIFNIKRCIKIDKIKKDLNSLWS